MTNYKCVCCKRECKKLLDLKEEKRIIFEDKIKLILVCPKYPGIKYCRVFDFKDLEN